MQMSEGMGVKALTGDSTGRVGPREVRPRQRSGRGQKDPRDPLGVGACKKREGFPSNFSK